MTTAAAPPSPRISRISGVLMVLAAVVAGFALAAPQADAAKKKQRIVAVSPFAAQTMVQLGVKPIRVGETLGATSRQRKLLRGIPMLKLSHPNGPNLEQMAKLAPDIVFSSSRWVAGHAALKRLGIRVVVADPTSPNAVYANVKKIARVIGRQKQAARLNKRIKRQLTASTRKIAGKREKVLVVLGIGTTAMAFLNNSWGGKIVQMAGGRLVTGGATSKGGFARISDEVVVAENPDRIIVVPHGTSQDLGRVAEYVKNNQAWQTTNAAKTGNIKVSVDNTLLQAGTDLGQTVKWVRVHSLKNW